MNSYEINTVFRYTGGGIRVYTCLRIIEENLYGVLQMNYVPSSIDSATGGVLDEINSEAFQLMIDEDPIGRLKWTPSLEEAISAHDIAFDN